MELISWNGIGLGWGRQSKAWSSGGRCAVQRLGLEGLLGVRVARDSQQLPDAAVPGSIAFTMQHEINRLGCLRTNKCMIQIRAGH